MFDFSSYKSFSDKDKFEKALKEEDIWFEKSSEDKRTRTFYLFGIHKNDFTIRKIPSPLISYSLV